MNPRPRKTSELSSLTGHAFLTAAERATGHRLGGAVPSQRVVGGEAEFRLVVNGREHRPEDVFGTPGGLLRHHAGRTIPRVGRSRHLPTGGALYFDTGVVEVATALIELDAPHGCARAVRSLWEQIAFVRGQINSWEQSLGKTMCLRGFSAHYNFSIFGQTPHRLRRLAYILPFILGVPTMLLAANRRSTAVGVRPRPGRIEVTADFTPDVALTNATVAFLAGVVTEVARWPDADLNPAAFAGLGLPRIVGFRPSKHSSRKGWRAHAGDFERNPVAADPGEALWLLEDGRRASLRMFASDILEAFTRPVRRYADRATFTHLREVLEGTARSLLDFDDRPAAYDDAGRNIDWGRRRARPLPRSAYEKVIQRVIHHEPIRIGAARYVVERMPGWYEFEFRDLRTGERRTFNLDELARHVGRDGV